MIRKINAVIVSSARSLLLACLALCLAVPASSLQAVELPYAGTDLRLWLKADTITDLTGADRVNTWPDTLGFGNVVAQDGTGPGGVKPLWVDSVINGLPVVRFNAGDRRIDGSAVLPAGSDARTVIIVGTSTSTANVVVFDLNGQGDGTAGNRLFRITPEVLTRYNNGNTTPDSAFSFGTTPQIFGAQSPAAATQDAVTFFNNSSTVITGTGSAGTAELDTGTAGYRFGTAFNGTSSVWLGDIAEVLVFEAELTPAELEPIGFYLQNKYAVGSSFAGPGDFYFDDLGADSDWGTGGNWDTAWEPGATQNAFVNGGLTAEVSQAGETAQNLTVGTTSTGGPNTPGTGTLNITGGDLTLPENGANGVLVVAEDDASGAAGVDGTVTMTGGTLTAEQIVLGRTAGEGLFTFTDGAIVVADSITGSTNEAIMIGGKTNVGSGGDGTFVMGNGTTTPTLNYTGGRFEIGAANGSTAVFTLNSGTVTGNGNLILGQGNDSSTSTFNLNGGSFTTTVDYNVNDGTAVHTQTGGTLNVRNWQLQGGGGAASVSLNATISGGTLATSADVVGRNGNSTITVNGTGSLTVGDDINFTNTTGRTDTLNIAGSGLVTVADQLNDQNGNSAINLSDSGRLEISGSATVREVDTLTMGGSSVLQLEVTNTTTGPSAPLNAITSGTFSGTPTVELVLGTGITTGDAGTSDTWTAETSDWDTTDGKWSLGVTPAAGTNTINVGDQFVVISSPSMTANNLVTSGTADWTVVTTATTVEMQRTGTAVGGAVTAVIDDALSIVTRNSDLLIVPAAGGDAAQLNVSNGSLTLSGTNDLILGGTALGVVNQTGGAVAVGGDLIYGPAIGDQGGTYTLSAGTLTVSGSVIETDSTVNSAQLYVDGGTLSVTGDITTQSFRTGNAFGSTGSYTMPSTQTLTNTGTFVVGEEGTGTFTSNGGTLVLASVDVGGTATGVGTLNINGGTVGMTALDNGEVAGASGTINITGGDITVTGGWNNAEAATTVGNVNVTGTDPVTIAVSGGNYEVANASTGTTTFNNPNLVYTQVNNNFIWGQEGTSEATFDLIAGTVNLGANEFRSNNGDSEANLSGGTLTGDNLDMSNNGAATAVLNLSGTDVSLLSNVNYRNNGTDTINFSGGTLEAGGNFNINSTGTNEFNIIGSTAGSTGTCDGICIGGNYNQNAASTLNYTFDPAGVTPIQVDGAVNTGTGNLGFDFTSMPAAIGDVVLIDNAGVDAISGPYAGLAEGTSVHTFSNGYSYVLTYLYDSATGTLAGNDLALIAVPEPGSLGLIALALAALACGGTRRRKR